MTPADSKRIKYFYQNLQEKELKFVLKLLGKENQRLLQTKRGQKMNCKSWQQAEFGVSWLTACVQVDVEKAEFKKQNT